jgi:hypothetical protein
MLRSICLRPGVRVRVCDCMCVAQGAIFGLKTHLANALAAAAQLTAEGYAGDGSMGPSRGAAAVS